MVVIDNKKQIILAGFNARVLANMIDLLVAMTLLMPLIQWLEPIFIKKAYNQDMVQDVVTEGMQKFPNSVLDLFWYVFQHMMDFFVNNNILSSIILFQLVQIGLLMLLFAIFYCIFKTTPGYRLMFIQVLDADTHIKVGRLKLIIRMICAFPLCIGFFLMIFNSKKQAWHDKITNTIVTKI